MRKLNLTCCLILVAIAGSQLSAQAQPDATSFVVPGAWSAGDADSTYQEWDIFAGSTGNLPDVGQVANPSISSDPIVDVSLPGFKSGSSNFYSFSGDYLTHADIYNHGGSSGAGSYDAGYGTHVIVQAAATMNGSDSVYADSLEVVTLGGSSIVGGDNASVLGVSELFQGIVSSSFGDVLQQELIFEFWLPGYTEDFRVSWDTIVHASFKALQVDSMIAAAAPSGGSPFSLTVSQDAPGDGNGDGHVDGLDYLIWAGHFGDDPAQDPPGSPENGDFNDDSQVDGLDYLVWASNFGMGPDDSTAVPEPGALALLGLALAGTALAPRRRCTPA